MRCGLLPVDSSCSSTATTTSSLMPSLSILLFEMPRGEGGGVVLVMAAADVCCRSLADDAFLDLRGEAGVELEEARELIVCDRFTRLAGGVSASFELGGLMLEGER